MKQSSQNTSGRWAIAWAGVIVMMVDGTVYAWSNFTQPLVSSFGWNATETSLVFGLAIFSLGIGAVFGGRWQDRVGPRVVTVIGIALWGIGNVLAALGPHNVLWWDLTYGVIGGFGNGMAYITPVATVTKWFPDKRGLASGLVVMGFGFGAFVYGFVLKAVPGFAQASRDAGSFADAKAVAAAAGTPFNAALHAMSQTDLNAITNVVLASGIVYAIIGCLAAMLLRNPPAGYSVQGMTAKSTSQDGSFTPAQVLRTPQLYLLWLMLFVNVVAGILVVSNAVPIIHELLMKGASGADQIKALTGEAISAYAVVAIFNGLGRFFWGAISDRIGRNYSIVAIYGCEIVIFSLVANFHNIWLVLFAFAVILACYGGGFGTMPAFNADYFGTKFLGQNYGYIITAWGTGGLVGPAIAGFVKDRTGSFSGALQPMAIMLLFAMILPFVTKKPPPATQTSPI